LTFTRYKERVTKEEYKEYLLNCRDLREEDIKNQDLKVHHQFYLDLFSRTEFYYNKYEILKQLVTPSLIEQSLELTKAGLPETISVDEIDFVFTIGIGMSFGYVYGDASHYDFITLSRDISFDVFFRTLSHEMHHICLKYLYPDNLTPLDLFIIYFSGEGLAVKYCNNAEGVLSKKVYDDKEKNIGLDPFTWNYLNNQFDEAFAYFKDILIQIKNQEIKTKKEVSHIIRNYFMNSYTKEQDKTEKPKLNHFLLYSMGNDLFGVIHDVFGKDKVYEVVQNPKIFVETFNKAVISLDKPKYIIA